MHYDVAVIGSGPAGAAAAIALARLGCSIAVLERDRFGYPRAGETVPPEICQPLRDLGVWDRFLHAGHTPLQGVSSAWGSSERREIDHLYNPHGCGWVLDRAKFDAMLISAAQQHGVRLYSATRVFNCERLSSGGWSIQAATKNCGSPIQIRAGSLVDASGRTGSTSLQRGNRIHADRLIGAVKIFRRIMVNTFDRRPLIESAETGWWYSAWLPGHRLAVALMTDPDQISGGSDHRAKLWLAALATGPHTKARLELCDLESELRIFPAGTSRAGQVVTTDSIVIGDAALSLDPLSGQGILHALQSALASAPIAAAPSFERIEQYSATIARSFDASLKTQASYYAMEQRWPTSPFWRRRHIRSG